MSDHRKPSAYFKFDNAKYKGKKVSKIELVKAKKWQKEWNPFKRTMSPTPHASNIISTTIGRICITSSPGISGNGLSSVKCHKAQCLRCRPRSFLLVRPEASCAIR